MYASHRVFSYELNEQKSLFLNTLTGLCLILPADYYKAFRQIKSSLSIESIDDTISQFFIKHNYVFENKDKEQNFFHLKYAESMVKIKKKTASFTIVPNFLCNFNCAYCFEPLSLRKINNLMSKETISSMFASMDTLISEKVFEGGNAPVIHIMGGEVFLLGHKSEIEEILRGLKVRNLKTVIITNAYYLEEFLPILENYKNQIKYIQITLDGTLETHNARRFLISNKGGTFEKIVKGINASLPLELPIHIRMNLDATNSNLEPFMSFFRSQGWDKIPWIELHPGVVSDMSDCGEFNELLDESNLQEIIRPYKELSCEKSQDVHAISFGLVYKVYKYLKEISRKNFAYQDCMTNSSFVYTPTGKIYQCSTTMHNEEHAIGEFYPTHWIYKSESRFGWDHIEEAREKTGCMTCATASLCPGPCPISAKKSDEKNQLSQCVDTESVIYKYLDLYKDEILKLPILELQVLS